MTLDYEPKGYWEERLESNFSLRGTGHIGYSARYNGWLYRRKAAMLDQALATVIPGEHALDIGSGVGWVVGQLLRRGLNVEGCDIADVSVRRLSEQYPGTVFFKAGVGSEPVPRDAATYHVVTMLDVAYHITNDDTWEAAVAEIGRVLKPGGILVVTDRLGEARARVAAHVQFRSRSDWERAAEKAGMRISRIGGLYTWLSRPPDEPGWERAPEAIRGAVEYLRDARIRHSAPHMRWAQLTKMPEKRPAYAC